VVLPTLDKLFPALCGCLPATLWEDDVAAFVDATEEFPISRQCYKFERGEMADPFPCEACYHVSQHNRPAYRMRDGAMGKEVSEEMLPADKCPLGKNGAFLVRFWFVCFVGMLVRWHAGALACWCVGTLVRRNAGWLEVWLPGTVAWSCSVEL
jgi:hypothetical protein